ncbi:MAG TPA: PAS domain S-box protein, partial [Terriglobales bacterium]|nr:PAS domain S-box protein [Terriglobales bacterium]
MWQKIKLIKSLDLGHFHWSIRYGAAAGFVFCALLLNYLPPARMLPFLFFFAAVALAARVCGFGPALFATALSAALAEYFLILPLFTFSHPATDLLRLLLFALVCLVISSIARQKSKAEKIAEENRSRLAAIVESSEDAIFSKTLEGAITSWNQSAQKLYGYTAGEIIHRNVKVLAAADKEEEIDDILRKLSRGERIEHYETQRLTRSGAKVDVSLSISPLFDLEGKIIGAATIARDITARKLSEEVLLKTEKLAAAGRLAATIAHEINNPLEAATNLLYLLGRNRSLDERARYHLALAEHELDRVAHMSRQTLGFYRDSSSPMTVEVAKVLDEVLGLYGRKLQAKAIAVQKEY